MGTFVRGAGDLRLGAQRVLGPSSLLTGLVNYWPMQETSGTRVDIVGGTNLTDNNTVGVGAGHVEANAANFVSANSEFLSQVGLSLGNNAYTWSFWVNVPAGMANHPPVVKGFADLSEYFFQFQGAPNIQVGFRTRGQSEIVTWGTLLAINTWYHILIWRNPGVEIGLAVNNDTPLTAATVGTITSSAQMFTCGNFNGSAFYGGLLEQLGRWSRLLTDPEKAALYNGGAGRAYPF